MNSQVLLIGGGLLQLPVLEQARILGVDVVCIDGNLRAPARDRVAQFLHCDIKDKDACLAAVKEFAPRGKIEGVLTVGTDFSTTVSWIAEHLNLPGTPYANVLNARNKGLMRQCFRDHGVSSPHFLVVQHEVDESFVPAWGFPAVVKPADNMGARGVRLVSHRQELPSAIREALLFSATGTALVEEYIPGPEFSVDAILHDGKVIRCGLADRTIAFAPHFVELGHTFPSTAADEVQESIWLELEKAVRALGLRNGAAKGDVKYDPRRGAVIGEVAHRLSGGFMSGWTYPLTSGRSSIRWALETCLGRPLSPQPQETFLPVAERAWIGFPGLRKSTADEAAGRQSEGVQDVFLLAQAGQNTVVPRNNVEKLGNLIAIGDTRAHAESAARQGLNRSPWLYQKSHGETDLFLKGEGGHPWAFEKARGRTIGSHVSSIRSQAQDQQWGDWYGNTFEEVLEVLDDRQVALKSRSDRFWRALLVGGISGALYAEDSQW